MAHYVIWLLLLATPAFGAWGFLDFKQTTGAGGPGGTKSVTLSCAGGNFLAVHVSGWNGSTIVTPTYDIGGGPVSFGTGATDATAQFDDGGAGAIGRLYIKTGITTTGSTVISTTTDYGYLGAMCFSGVGSYESKGSSNNGVSSATASAGSLLAVTSFTYDQTSTGTLSWTSPITPTVAGQTPCSGSSCSGGPRWFGGGMGYANTVSGTNTATWTGLGSGGTGIIIVGLSTPPATVHRNKFVKH